jgi:hypothetical protein
LPLLSLPNSNSVTPFAVHHYLVFVLRVAGDMCWIYSIVEKKIVNVEHIWFQFLLNINPFHTYVGWCFPGHKLSCNWMQITRM